MLYENETEKYWYHIIAYITVSLYTWHYKRRSKVAAFGLVTGDNTSLHGFPRTGHTNGNVLVCLKVN